MDEHSGEAGLLTRVESFVEMIRRKKRRLDLGRNHRLTIKSKQEV